MAALKDAVGDQMVLLGHLAADGSMAYLSTVQSSAGILGLVGDKIVRFFDLRRMAIMAVAVVAIVIVMFVAAREMAHYMGTKASRCFRQKQAFTRGDTVSAIVSKDDKDLMSVSYDLRAKMATTGCMCATGSVMNAIPFWRYDFKTKQVSQDALNCMCDTDYTLAPGAMTIVGDKNLATFMYTGDVTDAKKVFGVVQTLAL